MKHPLVNSDSKHYNNNGHQTIYDLEQVLTIREMIGFCKGNIFKYKSRLGKKEGSNDLKKIKTYENYLKLLQSLTFDDDSVLTKNVLEANNIIWN